jgi:hypothetical protein
MIGHATPFYYRLDRSAYTTVWDRGPMSEVMRENPGDQRAWANALRSAGFTHVLIDETMLGIWEHAGWNDPLLTREGLREFTQYHSEPLYEYTGGLSIHRLRP